MNDKDKYAPTGETMKRIANTVRYVETGSALPDGGLKKRHRLIPHEEGILLDDLDGTDDPNVPTTARFQIKLPHRTGNGWSDDVAPSIIKAMNRTPASFLAETPGFVVELQTDKWYFFTNGGSSAFSDGKVHAVHACGWYTVELGSIEQSVASGSGEEDCNPCSDVASGSASGSSADCELILGAIPIKVVGNGTYVLAYDPQSITIPLVLGSDCVVAKVSGGTPAASGSGSGGGSNVTPWRVTRGYQEHIVQYRERWDCCAPDGPPVLIGKTPIVLVGIECAEIICGECPASGSG
jgi:hypothetical protein